MATATTPDDIYQMQTGDAVDPATESSLQGQSVQDALDDLVHDNRQIQTYKWANEAARTAQTGMAEGDIGDQADTEQRWRYSGSVWAVSNSGLVPIRPTTVVNGAISGVCTVTFTGVTSVSLNGIFSSLYDWYIVEFDFTTSGAGIFNPVLRASGTDATTAYDSQRSTAINATLAAAQSLNAANWVGSGAVGIVGARQSGAIKLYNPGTAVATTGIVQSIITPNPMTSSAALYTGGLLHRTTTAYDGITLGVSTGNMAGTARVYGFYGG